MGTGASISPQQQPAQINDNSGKFGTFTPPSPTGATNSSPTTASPSGGKGGAGGQNPNPYAPPAMQQQTYMPPPQQSYYDQAFTNNPFSQQPSSMMQRPYGSNQQFSPVMGPGNAYARFPRFSPQSPMGARPPMDEMQMYPNYDNPQFDGFQRRGLGSLRGGYQQNYPQGQPTNMIDGPIQYQQPDSDDSRIFGRQPRTFAETGGISPSMFRQPSGPPQGWVRDPSYDPSAPHTMQAFVPGSDEAYRHAGYMRDPNAQVPAADQRLRSISGPTPPTLDVDHAGRRRGDPYFGTGGPGYNPFAERSAAGPNASMGLAGLMGGTQSLPEIPSVYAQPKLAQKNLDEVMPSGFTRAQENAGYKRMPDGSIMMPGI